MPIYTVIDGWRPVQRGISMDSFQTIVGSLLQKEGYCVGTSVKVDLTGKEKGKIGRPSSLRFLLLFFFLILLGCASTRISSIQTGKERYQMTSSSTSATPVAIAISEFHKKATEVCQGNYRFVEEWHGESRNADWLGWPSYPNFTLIATVQCQR